MESEHSMHFIDHKWSKQDCKGAKNKANNHCSAPTFTIWVEILAIVLWLEPHHEAVYRPSSAEPYLTHSNGILGELRVSITFLTEPNANCNELHYRSNKRAYPEPIVPKDDFNPTRLWRLKVWLHGGI
jgi:hypothetical protein